MSVADDIAATLPHLRSFAWSLTRNRADADDLVQDAALRALEHAREFMPGTSLRSWLARIMQNAWKDGRRKAVVRNRNRPQWILLHGDSIDGEQFNAVALRETLAVVERLPPKQRLMIERVAINGEAYRDVAADLGIPSGTVGPRLLRARAALAEAGL